MTQGEQRAARAALWDAMVESAERLHDAVVLGQPRANARTARRIAAAAQEISALAQAAMALGPTGRAPHGGR